MGRRAKVLFAALMMVGLVPTTVGAAEDEIAATGLNDVYGCVYYEEAPSVGDFATADILVRDKCLNIGDASFERWNWTVRPALDRFDSAVVNRLCALRQVRVTTSATARNDGSLESTVTLSYRTEGECDGLSIRPGVPYDGAVGSLESVGNRHTLNVRGDGCRDFTWWIGAPNGWVRNTNVFNISMERQGSECVVAAATRHRLDITMTYSRPVSPSEVPFTAGPASEPEEPSDGSANPPVEDPDEPTMPADDPEQPAVDDDGEAPQEEDPAGPVADYGLSPAFLELASRPDLTESHANILRLYWATFQREPDIGGATFWIEAYDSGAWPTLVRIGEHFAVSEEFLATYGTTTNAEYVDLLYQNTLGRPGDPGGRAFWIQQLDAGARTRGELLADFSFSSEFRSAHPLPSDGVPG